MYVNHDNGLWTKIATSRSFESYDQEFRRESPWTKIAYASVEALRYLLHTFSQPKRPSTDLLEISDMKSLVIQSNRQFFGLGLVPIKNRLTIHGLDKKL